MKPRPSIKPTAYLNQRGLYLRALQELKTPLPSVSLNGWRNFTDMTGGFRMREFSIFCGPTGVGKTQWLAALSSQLLRQEEKHLIMSVETGPTDLMKRIISELSGRDVNTGNAVNSQDLAKIHTQQAQYLESDAIDFALYEDRIPVEQLCADIRFMVSRGRKIATIDNLNFFMEVTSHADQIVEMDRVIHELIILCKQTDVHIIMVMHPKKTEHGRVENEFDIKGSATAVQEAHNVFLFNRPSQQDIQSGVQDWNDRELTIRKMRRRGQHVGKTLIFSCIGGKYQEKGMKAWRSNSST